MAEQNAEARGRYRPQYRTGFGGDIVHKLIERAGFVAGDVVLEIGSGTGDCTEALLTRGINVLSIEPDERMQAAARKRLGDYTVKYRTELYDHGPLCLPAAYFARGNFDNAVKANQSAGPFDGIVSLNPNNWPINQNGLPPTPERLAGLLKPGKRLATLQAPLEMYSERSAEFFEAFRELWPPEFMGNVLNRASLTLQPAQDILPCGASPHLAPVSFETWTADQDMPVDDYLGLMHTGWDMAELPDAVREGFSEDIRHLSLTQFGGIVPVTHATSLQIDERPLEPADMPTAIDASWTKQHPEYPA